jgi:dipeptidase E
VGFRARFVELNIHGTFLIRSRSPPPFYVPHIWLCLTVEKQKKLINNYKFNRCNRNHIDMRLLGSHEYEGLPLSLCRSRSEPTDLPYDLLQGETLQNILEYKRLTRHQTMTGNPWSFDAPEKLKGLFVGSGSDGLSEEWITKSILDLLDDKTKTPKVLYLGTATYDLPGPRYRQTHCFTEAGCDVTSLDITFGAVDDMASKIEEADIILVSGGNTLFAVDHWKRLGVHDLLRKAMHRGAVLTGGSAGGICWFDGGHSDSMDPSTFMDSMLALSDSGKDESSNAPTQSQDNQSWEYIRVDALGFLPGLVCPHHDKRQSNGILRAANFDAMLLEHPTEFGIGIDHWAALELRGGNFRVLSIEGKEGSVLPDGSFSPDRMGRPGIWLKKVLDDGRVHSMLCPQSGKISDLLRIPSRIRHDPRVDECRKRNRISNHRT